MRLMHPESVTSPAMPQINVPAHTKAVHPLYFFLLRLSRRIGNLLFRPRVSDLERFPAHGPVLLLPNHISYGDAALIQTACPRHVRFVVYEPFYRHWALGWIMRMMRTIPIMPGKSSDVGVKACVEGLEAGHVVCLFPEGGISRVGKLTPLKHGFERIAAASGCPVQPVRIDGLRRSGFAVKRGEVTVRFGEMIPAERAKIDVVTAALQPSPSPNS